MTLAVGVRPGNFPPALPLARALLVSRVVASWFHAAALGVALSVSSATAQPTLPASEPVWLVAVDVRGRSFDLTDLRGQIVLLTVASRRTASEARAIHERLAPLVAPGEFAVVSVISLDEVPSFAHGYARRRIAEAASRSRVIHLLDERGRLCRILAVRGGDILLIDRGGLLRRRFRGQADLPAALEAVDALRRDRG